MEGNVAAKKGRATFSAMDEFDIEKKISEATKRTLDADFHEREEEGGQQKSLQKKEEELKQQYRAEKKKKPLGRPKKNPYADEKKLTIRMPESLHRQLRFASADTGKPMVEIAVDSLIRYLAEYEGK